MTNQKIVFHIGFHKTGTSTLQKDYWIQVKDFHYYEKDGFETISKKIKNSTGDNLLFSFEDLTGCLQESYLIYSETWYELFEKSVRELRALIEQFNVDYKIIITIRQPKKWIRSIYNHYLKYGGYIGFSEFVLTRSLDEFSQKKRINKLLSVFNSSKVLILPIEQLSTDGEKTLGNINTFLEIEHSIKLDGQKIRNRSLSQSALKFILFINRCLNWKQRHPQGKLKKLNQKTFYFARFLFFKFKAQTLIFPRVNDLYKIESLEFDNFLCNEIEFYEEITKKV